jgi:hypothetical protein
VVPGRKSGWGYDVKHSLLCVGLVAGLFFALDDLAAVETAIDDTTIELVAPTGYCPLDRNDWPESRLIDFTSSGIKKQGERLGYFVDCKQARSWHEGSNSKNEGDIVDYQASLEFRSENVTSTMLEEVCATLHKSDDTTKGWLEIFLNAIKSAIKGRYGGEEDSTLSYVVLGYEDTTCYVFRASIMRNREQFYTVSALTILKSKVVTVHLSRKFGNMDLLKGKAEEVITHLFATAQETTTALIAANR